MRLLRYRYDPSPPLIIWWSHFFLSKEQRKKERKKERRRRKYNWTDSFICFVSISNCGSYEIFFCFCFFFVFVFYGGKQIQKTKGGVGREGGREGRGLCNCNCNVSGNRGRLSSSYLAFSFINILKIDTPCALTSPRCQRFIRQSQQFFFLGKKESIPTSSFPINFFLSFFLFTNFPTFFLIVFSKHNKSIQYD